MVAAAVVLEVKGAVFKGMKVDDPDHQYPPPPLMD
jgi:hypothetical protein